MSQKKVFLSHHAVKKGHFNSLLSQNKSHSNPLLEISVTFLQNPFSRRSLTSDFRNPAELAANAKHRLDFLKVATMKEEQSMNKLELINSNFDHYRQHVNGSTSIMDELMKDVSKAADLLESAMREHNEVAFQAGNIEAVMHLHDDDEDKTDFGEHEVFGAKDDYGNDDGGYNPAGNMKSRAEAQMQLDREFNAYGGVLGMDDVGGGGGGHVVKKERMDKMREKQEGESVDAGDILVDSQNNKYRKLGNTKKMDKMRKNEKVNQLS